MPDDDTSQATTLSQVIRAGLVAGACSALCSAVGPRFAPWPQVWRVYGSLEQDGQALAQDSERLFGPRVDTTR